MILDQAFRYITELKKQNDTLLLEGGDEVQGIDTMTDIMHNSPYQQFLKDYDCVVTVSK